MAAIVRQDQELTQTPRAAGSSSDTLTSADFRLAPVFEQCDIIDELGRGGGGVVYLARQPHLANRLVVLKFIPASEGEHLSLARLQHPNIVPLFEVYECAEQKQRALCMPFFGSVTLSQMLNSLHDTPCSQRRAHEIIACLDRARSRCAPALGHESAARETLLKADYVSAICWIGASLADGLQYAHERGLLHLDLKPSNVLFATDGNPMLLDFHLARPPVQAGEAVTFLGGTARYMAPEQHRVSGDIAENRPASTAVDARADIFSLGVMLYECLSGKLPYTPDMPMETLHQVNPRVSIGLSDIVHKALAVRVENRYQSAAELARDLRLHLESKPLHGVENRHVGERLRKWHRRRPFRIALIALLLSLFGTAVASGVVAWQNAAERRQTAAELHAEGARQFEQGHYAQAIGTLTDALELAQSFGGDAQLAQTLTTQLQLAERADKAEKLHLLVEGLRLHTLAKTIDQRTVIVLDLGCRDAWQKRGYFLDEPTHVLDRAIEQRVRRDLVEIALGAAELRLQLDVREPVEARRQQGIQILDDAESFFGRCPALTCMRSRIDGTAANLSFPDDAWGYYTLGRVLLGGQRVDDARAAFAAARRLEPGEFWSNLFYGVCAAEQRAQRDAVAAFSACIGQQPNNDICFVRRAQSYTALGEWEAAQRDLQRALQIRPNVPEVLAQLAEVNEAMRNQKTRPE